MNHKELILAAEFLEQHSDDLSDNGCNDWEYPDDWTEQEKIDFCRKYHSFNKSPEDFDPDDLTLPDFAVASFLAHKLTLQAEHEKKMDEVDYQSGDHD